LKVMLINPRPLWDRLGPMERFSPAIPPLGVVWSATVLQRKGHDVRVVDQHALGFDTCRLMGEVRTFQPQLVGFSCLTFTMDGVEEAVRCLRSDFPAVKIVLGNLHATLFHQELVQAGLCDFVVRGESEWILPRLVASLAAGAEGAGVPGVTRRVNGQAVVEEDAPPVDLGALPTPDWNLVSGIRYEAFRLKEYDEGPLPAAVQASRGCAFNCDFCSQNVMHPKLRMRPVDAVIAELKDLHFRLGVTTVGFVDANFPPTPAYGLEFADKMEASGLAGRMRWFTEIRVDLVDEPLISRLADVGLSLVQFGVESGDPDVLSVMKKQAGWTDPADAFAWCRQHGIMTVGLFVLGMPGETEQQAMTTVKLALRLDPDLAKFSVATPYPGSGLWYKYRDELEGAPAHKFSGWLDPKRGGPHLLEGHTLPGAKLARLQRRAMRKFYLRPAKLKKLFGQGLLREETLLDGLLSLGREVVDRMVGLGKKRP
jgi:anaerobic magnesium-protoporphyrin IX monomethyl ester cyclase